MMVERNSTYFPLYPLDNIANIKCYLMASECGEKVQLKEESNEISGQIVLPALVTNHNSQRLSFFGSNSICRFLAHNVKEMESNSPDIFVALQHEELIFHPMLSAIISKENKSFEGFDLAAGIAKLIEELKSLDEMFSKVQNKFLRLIYCPSLIQLADSKKISMDVFPALMDMVKEYRTVYEGALQSLQPAMEIKPMVGEIKEDNKTKVKESKSKDKESKKKAKTTTSSSDSSNPTMSTFSNDDIKKPVLESFNYGSTGLMSSLRLIFSAAILAAFPNYFEFIPADEANASQSVDSIAIITRCNNPTFGDFQCNNAMSIAKALKNLSGYSGPISPKDVAERISVAIPDNALISSTSTVPNGYINIVISLDLLKETLSNIVCHGLQPPYVPHRKVLVDFSSPNIAKEMHVGHLRSTIIGDCLSNIFEFCKFDVMRVNHVGDWGTQFGMLITYLLEEYPDILENPVNISDLTQIYKASKKWFDTDANFKEQSRLNVVKLQSGDPQCRMIWSLLCKISRVEFEHVYEALGVRLQEFGESFYNAMIPDTIAELRKVDGLVEEDEGMIVIKLPHFTIPLILRKSDGGYGYDSTDMAALRYRIFELRRDWIIIITDAGQAPHFQMCFDAGRAAGWFPNEKISDSSSSENHVSSMSGGDSSKVPFRVDHIGFGVVCGDDGKRFKTRSSDTVRLIDLLNTAKEKMKESLELRIKEGKSPLTTPEEVETAARIIGFGAVKYFDLKNNPTTNYIFKYERMLDTKGDTAVYLLFAYARTASILKKAQEERNIDIQQVFSQPKETIQVSHPAERALAFEILQFGDVIKMVMRDLLPNRLCDYLNEIATKFSDFVTKCHVLNAESVEILGSRLILCECTRRIMDKCFHLLGIESLDRF